MVFGGSVDGVWEGGRGPDDLLGHGRCFGSELSQDLTEGFVVGNFALSVS